MVYKNVRYKNEFNPNHADFEFGMGVISLFAGIVVPIADRINKESLIMEGSFVLVGLCLALDGARRMITYNKLPEKIGSNGEVSIQAHLEDNIGELEVR